MLRLPYEKIMKMPPHFMRWDLFVSQPKEVVEAAKKPGVLKTEMGQAAKAFIQSMQNDQTNQSLCPPMTREGFTALAQELMGIDKDVTKTQMWKNYWSQPLIAQGVDPALRKQYQKRLLGQYRQQVFQSLVPQTDDEMANWIARFDAIPLWDHLTQVQAYAEQYGLDAAYDKLMEDAEHLLKEKQTALLENIASKAESHTLLTTISHLEKQWEQIVLSSAYYELGEDKANEILDEVYQKLMGFKKIISLLNDALEQICALSLQNVVLQSEIKKVMTQFLEAANLEAIEEISVLDCLEYLDQPEQVAKIHETVMSLRLKECLTLLEDSVALRQEIRKETVYRVRRNLIETIFQEIHHRVQAELSNSRIISESLENVLMLLQEEYLHTLYRQIEGMPLDKVDAFLKRFELEPLLAPLPPSKQHRQKNRFARREFHQIQAQRETLAGTNLSTEEIPLHHIDSPFERDILGEICQQLISVAGDQLSDSGELNLLLAQLSQTYNWILSPDFTIESEECIAFRQGDYEAVKAMLEKMAPSVKKCQKLERCYEEIQTIGLLPASLVVRFLNTKRNRLHNLNEWVQLEYLRTLKELSEKTPFKTIRDKYVFYSLSLKDRLSSKLVADCEKKPQQAKALLNLLQLVYVRRAQ